MAKLPIETLIQRIYNNQAYGWKMDLKKRERKKKERERGREGGGKEGRKEGPPL